MTTLLDTEELFQFAIRSIQAGDHEAGLNYLKQVLVNEPLHARALYLQAAEHAELGLFERAMAGMEQALQQDPNIELARFQLALLYLRFSRADEAKTQLQQLSDAPDPGIRLCARGVYEMANNEFQAAHDTLHLAVQQLDHNPSLREDMRRLAEQAQLQLQQPSPSAAEAPADAGKTVYLGEYRKAHHEPDKS